MSFQNGPCFRGLLFFMESIPIGPNSPRRSFHTIGWHPPNSFWKFRYLFSHHPDYFWKILKHSILSPFFGEDSKTEFFYHNRFWQRSDLITVLTSKKTTNKKNTCYIIPTSISDPSVVSFSLFRILLFALFRFFPQFCTCWHRMDAAGWSGILMEFWSQVRDPMDERSNHFAEPTIPLGSHRCSQFAFLRKKQINQNKKHQFLKLTL